MDRPVSDSQVPRSHNFDLIRDSMLQSSELPLTEVLDSNPWEDIFVAHHNSHNSTTGAIHPPQKVTPTNHTPQRFGPAGPRLVPSIH